MLFVSCDAVATVGTATIQNPAGTATSASVTASASPGVTGDIEVLRATFGQTITSITPPSGFTLACTASSFSGYLYYHVTTAGESKSYGTLSWTPASAGTIIIGERSGMNTTTPFAGCSDASIAGTVLTPSLALAAPTYQGSVAEAVFETPITTRCTGGAGTCNASGFTETAYLASGVLGEAQFAAATAPPTGNTVSMTLVSASAPPMVRVLGFYDLPSALATYPPNCVKGAMMRGQVGC